MSDSLFLRLDGIPGEEQDDRKLIRIFSYSHGLHMQLSSGRPSQGDNPPLQRSYCQHANFAVTKALDKASPKIFTASSLGTCFEHAIVYICSPRTSSNETEAKPVLSIVMKDAVIADFKYGFQGDWQVEHLSFVYGSIGWTLDWITPDKGELENIPPVGWDGTKNAASEEISVTSTWK